ncbi:MAG: T9SS type A sorting domain-containing protein [Flavobacteriaceae bacterium]|nr:T9SS type A sorting domain-containing protein [Flavobacteriaceae bacterium]
MKRGGFFTWTFLMVCCCTISAQVPCGSGFVANGIDDFIGIPDTDNINQKSVLNRTIEFWFKAKDVNTKQVLYEEGGGSKAFLFYLEGGRVYCGAVKNSPTEGRFFRSALDEIAVDTWYHVAMTLAVGNTFTWFLNGEVQDSQPGFTVGTHNGDITLAKSDSNLKYPLSLADVDWPGDTYNGALTASDNSPHHFEGNISLFRVWNTPRDVYINQNKLNYLTSGTNLVAYQKDTNEIMYEPSGAGTSIAASAKSDAADFQYRWSSGGVDDDWVNNSNWYITYPKIDKVHQTVLIELLANDPIITTEVVAGEMTIEAGVNLTIQNGGTLHIYTGLTNNGTITIEDGGSLVYHPCNTPTLGSNTVVIKRNSPTYPDKYIYSYWSSPLIQVDSDPSVIFPSSPVIWYFDASGSNADWANNSGANFIPGVGYAVRSESIGITTATFTGALNEGEISVPIYFNSNLASTQGTVWSTAGDNLLGNPYTATLDWDVIIQDVANDHLEGDIYYWDQSVVLIGDNDVNDYKQYNLTGGTGGATGNIGSGQGFFIRTTDASPSTFTFKPTYQKAGLNTQFYKNTKVASKKEGRSWFLLKKLGETLYSSTLIGFVKGATDYYDRLYDAPFDINNSKLGLYSIVIQPKSNQGGPPPPPNELKKASIQGLPVLSAVEKIVSLGVVVEQAGKYTIEIDEEFIDEKYAIYLEDTYQDKTVNLKDGAYYFKVRIAGEFNDRFKLHYTKSSLALDVDESVKKELELMVYVDAAKQLNVDLKNTSAKIKHIQLFDLLGREIRSFSPNDLMNISTLRSGVYIVSVKLDSNQKINKKIIISN